MLSIPLVINAITTDVYLRWVSLLSSLGGFAIYQFSHFSIIERHFKKTYDKISMALIAFGLVLFLAQIYEFYFVHIAAIFIVYVMAITYTAKKKCHV